MPRSPAPPIDPKLPAHLRAAFEKIDRDADPWFLPNWRVSILGDAKIYFDNPRIRETALRAIGIGPNYPRIQGFLRQKMRIEFFNLRDAVAFRRFASMLIGERRLAREGARAIAKRFEPQVAE